MEENIEILNIILNVINAICLLFCFVKMEITPWAAIVPVYGNWCLYDRIWGIGWLSLLLFVPYLGLVLSIATYWTMFRRFGKGTLFCLFGVIFQPIAIAICAFDSSVYSI